MNDSRPGPQRNPSRLPTGLSRSIDRAAAQAEAAEAMGDAATATAWRRVLADLQGRIP